MPVPFMKRTFIAIHITPGQQIINLLDDSRNLLQKEKIKWVHPGNIHITLKFLGETAEENIPLIIKEIKAVLSDCNSFLLRFRGTGVFRNIHDPRVFWIGIEEDKNLYAIRDKLEVVMEKLGFKREEKSFSPHLTLARIKYIRNKNLLGDLVTRYKDKDFLKMQVKEIIYYESILKPEGPEYIELAVIPLKD